jgi:hypothetical protein
MIASIGFTGGLILADMGALGLYSGDVSNEADDRPVYLIHYIAHFDEREACAGMVAGHIAALRRTSA